MLLSQSTNGAGHGVKVLFVRRQSRLAPVSKHPIPCQHPQGGCSPHVTHLDAYRRTILTYTSSDGRGDVVLSGQSPRGPNRQTSTHSRVAGTSQYRFLRKVASLPSIASLTCLSKPSPHHPPRSSSSSSSSSSAPIRSWSSSATRRVTLISDYSPSLSPHHHRHLHLGVCGITAEDPNRVWERRAPLTPGAVRELVKEGVKVLVQPCNKRVFKDWEYEKAGAILTHDLSPESTLILGIKEIPKQDLKSETTYAFFSHTHKGQVYNLPLLKRMLEVGDHGERSDDAILYNEEEGGKRRKESIFIDWELLTKPVPVQSNISSGASIGTNTATVKRSNKNKYERTAAFGHLAGYSGLVDGLSQYGLKALASPSTQTYTPFLNLPKPYMINHGLKELKDTWLKELGKRIGKEGTGGRPLSEGGRLGPMVIGIAGKGRVSQGVAEALNDINGDVAGQEVVHWVQAHELEALFNNKGTSLKKVYACQLELGDYLTKIGDGNGPADTSESFDREQYREKPDMYISEFDTKIAPYLSMFVNGGFWEPGCPRILTTAQLSKLQEQLSSSPESCGRFMSIVDISCDFGGGLEFITRATTLDDPVVQFDSRSPNTYGKDASQPRTVQISSIEILPSALPLDSSIHFSNCILPYVRYILGLKPDSKTADFSSSSQTDPNAFDNSLETRLKKVRALSPNEIKDAIERAVIVRNGTLKPGQEKLYSLLDQHGFLPSHIRDHPKKRLTVVGGVEETRGQTLKRRKRVVMLGSGLVAGPAVKTLAARTDLDLVIASNDLKAAKALAESYPNNVSTACLDVADAKSLDKLIKGADVVLSLLPAPLHGQVADLCITHQASLVTASYVSPAMLAKGQRAKEAGIVILNELGLDPGIDHCSAMRLIEQARESGNEIVSFVSFCGGLPSPEASNGPLGYKFSWSPRGVLTAASNTATFRIDGKTLTIEGENLLEAVFEKVPIIKGFAFEGLANRDSVSYLEQYGLPESLPTILRGTLRYENFSKELQILKRMGWLDQEPFMDLPRSWMEATEWCLRRQQLFKSNAEDPALIVRRLVLEQESASGINDVIQMEKTCEKMISTLQELSLLAQTPNGPEIRTTVPQLPSSNGSQSPLDLLSLLLGDQLKYEEGERDAVILHHELCTRLPNGEFELFTSTLVQYGTPESDSAMAVTVGTPIAIGVLLCLDGKLKQTGLVSPSSEEVWKPLLKSLKLVGIDLVESRKKVQNHRGVLDVLERQVHGMMDLGLVTVAANNPITTTTTTPTPPSPPPTPGKIVIGMS